MNAGDLIRQAETYAAHTGRSLSTVSSYAVRDGKFFDRLKSGGGCTLKTASKLIGWFDQNWPSDLEWPKGIDRPSQKRRAA